MPDQIVLSIDTNFQGSVYAVRWSEILRPVPGIDTLRNRRRPSAFSDGISRSAFRERFPMERLVSDDMFVDGVADH